MSAVPPRPKFRPDDPDAPFVPDESKINPRLIDLKGTFLTAIGAIFREKKITRAEYEQFRELLVALQEIRSVHGWFDVWLDQMIDEVSQDEWAGTTSNPEGPLYLPGAPVLEPVGPGATYILPQRPDEAGTVLIVTGQVRSLDGRPLPHAELDIWQCADTGIYSNFGMDDQPAWNLRGKFRTDAEGRYELRTIKPVPYMTPGVPQIMLDMWDALGKAPFRPAHVHMKVWHEDLPGGVFMTQIYFAGDPYLEFDAGENSRHSLEVHPVRHDGPEELKARGLEGRPFFLTTDFDLVVETATSDRSENNVHAG
jgi:catechol 1,2-dioxygenase